MLDEWLDFDSPYKLNFEKYLKLRLPAQDLWNLPYWLGIFKLLEKLKLSFILETFYLEKI